MGSKTIGLRLPDDLAQELEKVSAEKGQTTSEFVRKLIDDALYPAKTEDKGELGEDGEAIPTEVLAEVNESIEDLYARLNDAAEYMANNTQTMVEFNSKYDTLKELVSSFNNALKGLSNWADAQQKKAIDSVAKLDADSNEKIDKVQKMVDDLAEGQNQIRTKLTTHGHEGLTLIPQLNSKLQQVSEEITRLQVGVAKAQLLAVRKPTDDFERLEYTNGSKHTFRVYRSSRGLTQPKKIGSDLALGDKYVDLAEPEN